MDNVSEAPGFKLRHEQVATAASAHGARERWRKGVSVLSIVAIVAALAVAPPSEMEGWKIFETYSGLMLVIVAVLGRLWCAVYIGGRKNSELCMLGPYSLVRHPLYLFSSLGLFGVLLATHRPAVAAVGFLAFWSYHMHVMREEDMRLAARFEEAFYAYAKRVRSVWPRFGAYVDVTNLSVNLGPLRRAFSEVIWFFVFWALANMATA